MKLLKLLLFASLVMFISPSCSDDDDDKKDDKPESIVGTWNFDKTTDFQLTVKSNNTTFDTYCKMFIQAKRMPDKMEYTFTEDGKFMETDEFNGYPKEEFEGTYTYKENVLTIKLDGEEAGSASATIKDNVLTLTEDALKMNVIDEELLDAIFDFYKEELKDVDRSTLKINEVTYFLKFEKK